MTEDFSEKLKGFEDVWRRVEKAGDRKPAPPLMPAKQPVSRAIRFVPNQRQA